MKVVSIANQKGGVGKSLITTLLAQTLSQNYSKRILIIDSDPQQSISELRKFQKQKGANKFSYEIESSDVTKIDTLLEKYKNKIDIVFIDLPGRLYDLSGNIDSLIKIFWYSDHMFIPIQSGKTEILSSFEYYRTLLKVKEAKEKNNMHFDIHFFINQFQKNNDYKTLDFILEANNSPVMKCKLRKSLEYERNSILEDSILNVSKSDIYNEFSAFVDEFLSIINKK
jgi:chromosome partitioning protein